MIDGVISNILTFQNTFSQKYGIIHISTPVSHSGSQHLNFSSLTKHCELQMEILTFSHLDINVIRRVRLTFKTTTLYKGEKEQCVFDVCCSKTIMFVSAPPYFLS